MAKNQRVIGRYESFSYAYLYEAARSSLEQAKGKLEGQFYNNLTTMLMSAFCLEAYLNHVGPHLFRHWSNEVKRGTSTESKLRLVCSVLRFSREESDETFRKARVLISFRNATVHAETEKGDHVVVLKEGRPQRLPGAKWTEQCTVGNAEQYLKTAERIINLIHERAELPPPALGIFGGGGYVYTKQSDESPQ